MPTASQPRQLKEDMGFLQKGGRDEPGFFLYINKCISDAYYEPNDALTNLMGQTCFETNGQVSRSWFFLDEKDSGSTRWGGVRLRARDGEIPNKMESWKC